MCDCQIRTESWTATSVEFKRKCSVSCCLRFASQETDELLSVSAVGHSIVSILRTGKVQGSKFSKNVEPYRPEITVCSVQFS